MINWKIPAGFAAFGAVVSLLAGAIGGNPFGIIILRLFLSSVVLAGVGLGFNFIFKRFFPELGSSPARVTRDQGEEVDIVIDEDVPLEAGSVLGEPLSAGAVDQPEPESAEIADVETIEEAEEVLAEDLDEVPEFAGEPFLEEDAEPSTAQPAEPAATPPPAGTKDANAPSLNPVGAFEDLDTLPDIDQFSPSTDTPAATPKPGEHRHAQVDEIVKGQDPADLAKAVRTFMNKDQ